MNTNLVPLLNHNFDKTRNYYKTTDRSFTLFCIDVDGKWFMCCKKGEPEYEVRVVPQQLFTSKIEKI